MRYGTKLKNNIMKERGTKEMQHMILDSETGELILWVDQTTKRYIIADGYDVLSGEDLTVEMARSDAEGYTAHIVGEECTEIEDDEESEDEEEEEEYSFESLFNELYDYTNIMEG